MSFVTDQIRRIDAHLDRHQPRAGSASGAGRPGSRNSTNSSTSTYATTTTTTITNNVTTTYTSSSNNAAQARPPTRQNGRVDLLESLIKTVTNASSNQTILSSAQLQNIVHDARGGKGVAVYTAEKEEADEGGRYAAELEWLLVSKVVAQVRGNVLNKLLDEITPVMDDIYYWDSVLGSYNYSALYMVQLLPRQLYIQGKEALSDARENLQSLRDRGLAAAPTASGIAHEWRQFYGLVRDSIRERRLNDIQTRLLSPVAAARVDARQRLQGVNKQKQMCAAAIGILANESMHPSVLSAGARAGEVGLVSNTKWKRHVASSVRLMTNTISFVSQQDTELNDYERSALKSSAVDEDRVEQIYAELDKLLSHVLPQQTGLYREQRLAHGRPSRWTRYWLPATALLLSSTTLLRILVNRKADIVTWIQDFGKTTMAFWQNWVVDPIKDIIKTIRHDKDSEIALMSRESLESDRASLQRMVVDFAIENPETAGGPPLDEDMVELIRAKVREGDLTPVLRAYEHDLKRPFARAVTGNLVRELLIQIQKTKVDVEVAMSGIDALLKSQELVFGLVGLTPGVLVCIMLARWLSTSLGGRKGRSQGRLQDRMIRELRNIDRVLSNAEPQDDGILKYRDHGLILCEVQVLQANSSRVFPGEINREFLEDLKDLTDIHLGIERHIKVVDRLRWAYWKWLR